MSQENQPILSRTLSSLKVLPYWIPEEEQADLAAIREALQAYRTYWFKVDSKKNQQLIALSAWLAVVGDYYGTPKEKLAGKEGGKLLNFMDVMDRMTIEDIDRSLCTVHSKMSAETKAALEEHKENAIEATKRLLARVKPEVAAFKEKHGKQLDAWRRAKLANLA